MGKKRELAKNTFIILFGKICTQFMSFLLLPLYTSVLTSSDFGIIDLIVTYVALFVPIVTLQLETSIFRFLIDARNNDLDKSKIISNSFILTAIQLIIGVIVLLIASLFIGSSYVVYILFLVIATILSNVSLQIARGLGDSIGFSIGSAIAGIFTILLNVLFLIVLDFGPSSILVATAISNIMCFMYIWFRIKIKKYLDVKLLSIIEVKKLLKYSLPLIPNGIVWWVINAADRTIINIFLGVSANGIYAVSRKFSNTFISVYNIFNLSWTESAALHIEDEDSSQFFSETITSMLNLFASISVGIMACMPFVFPFFINMKFEEAYMYIPPLLIATLFNVIVGLISVVYVAKKLTKEIAKTSIMSGLISIVINLLLVRSIGIYASAVASIVAFASMSVYRYIDVQKYVKIKIEFYTIFLIIMIFTLSTILYYIDNLYLNVANLIVVIIFSVVMNKQLISKIFSLTSNKIFKKNI